MVDAIEPPSYSRAPAGSMLDPLEPVLRRLVEDWPDIKAPRVTEILRDDYGYAATVDLVRKRLAVLRPESERAAQKTGYRPGQVLQVDWAEMPTRPKVAGRERGLHALMFSLPVWGGDGALQLRHDDRVVPRRACPRLRVARQHSRECVYDNLVRMRRAPSASTATT